MENQILKIQKLIDNLSWSAPTKNKQGEQIVFANPSSLFWAAWKVYKDYIKDDLGILVEKQAGKYIIKRYVQSVNNNNSSKPELKKLKFQSLLKPYQRKHTLKIVNAMLNKGNALDASDTGTGKTFVALVTAKELNLTPFVICTKSGIDVWFKAARMLDMDVEKMIVLNYEKLRRGNTEYLTATKSKKIYWYLENAENYLLIWDEVHRCKNYKSLNSAMLIQAKIQNFKNLMLSATVAENPLHLKAVGYVLNLFPSSKHFWSWIHKFGCYRQWHGGLEFTKDTEKRRVYLSKIHHDIFDKTGSRIRIQDLGDLFPENQIVAEAYTMPTAKKIQKVYNEMAKSLELLKKKSALDAESPLTIILRARQEVELLKVPAFVDLAENMIEEGLAVVIFVNFKETLYTLSEKLQTKCIVHGDQRGKAGKEERAKKIEMFKEDRSRIIICNIGAGSESISLSDYKGQYRRVSLISPPWSALQLIQALGRIHRADSKTKCLQRLIFAANTVEERVVDIVAKKITNINLLNDDDLTDSFYQKPQKKYLT